MKKLCTMLIVFCAIQATTIAQNNELIRICQHQSGQGIQCEES